MRVDTRRSVLTILTNALFLVSASALEARTAIHFADIGNIRSWHSESADEIYIQAQNRQWYRATFWAPCQALPFSIAVSFVTEPNGDLDAYSSLLVEGERCWFRSFEESAEPERRRGGRDSEDEE